MTKVQFGLLVIGIMIMVFINYKTRFVMTAIGLVGIIRIVLKKDLNEFYKDVKEIRKDFSYEYLITDPDVVNYVDRLTTINRCSTIGIESVLVIFAVTCFI